METAGHSLGIRIKRGHLTEVVLSSEAVEDITRPVLASSLSSNLFVGRVVNRARRLLRNNRSLLNIRHIALFKEEFLVLFEDLIKRV